MGSDVKVVTQKVIQIIGFVNTLTSYTVVGTALGPTLTVGVPAVGPGVSRTLFSPGHQSRSTEVRPQDCSNHGSGPAVGATGTAQILACPNPPMCTCPQSLQLLKLDPSWLQERSSVQMFHRLSGGIKDFSTCSLDDFKYFAAHSGLECLHKILPVGPVYKQRKMCGNGKLESGEECDCGTLQNCTHPDCCDPRTCTKKKNKICGAGECCTQDCKIKPVNTPCRQPVDECDFLEFCDGNNAHCVPDTYARDGQSCDSGDSFCYKGRCRSFTRQCRKLIGG
ncbi:PREDICTED: disintegrin and metalloproteinase domain-containing protein 5-like, partial [Lipotes vexillifer]|uniref:Disintegrin and metalloproteinase domain-containing protein 5-like n=1 Tax=Lipotes vexillifer TaxID=118797 RepID=A0A340YD33_LIPVE